MASVSDPRPLGLQNCVVYREVALVGSADIGDVPTGPTLSAGTGAPTHTRPAGSIFLRKDGAADTFLYITSGAGTWIAMENAGGNVALPDGGILSFGAGNDVTLTHDGVTTVNVAGILEWQDDQALTFGDDADGSITFTSATPALDVTIASANLALATTTAGNISLTAADDIDLVATGSDVDIDAATLTADLTGAVSIDSVGNSNVTTDTGNLTLETTTSGTLSASAADNLTLFGAGAMAGAIVMEATDAAGGIDIDAGTGGIAIDSTGVISIEGVGASDVTTDTGNLTLTTTTSGDVVLEGADNVVARPGAAGAVQVQDGTDNTKVIDFDASGITTGNIRTLAMADIDVSLDELTTAPTLTPGAEAANVIAITFASPVASVERYEAVALDDTTMEVNTAAFTCAETGVGAEVSPTARGRLIFTTDASGDATVSVTDVAGASSKTVWVEFRPLFASADQAQLCAPVAVSITFDGA